MQFFSVFGLFKFHVYNELKCCPEVFQLFMAPLGSIWGLANTNSSPKWPVLIKTDTKLKMVYSTSVRSVVLVNTDFKKFSY